MLGLPIGGQEQQQRLLEHCKTILPLCMSMIFWRFSFAKLAKGPGPSGSSCLACVTPSVECARFGDRRYLMGLCCLCPWHWAQAASPWVAETLAQGKKDACCCMGRVGVFARSPLVGPRLRVVRSPLLIFLLEGL